MRVIYIGRGKSRSSKNNRLPQAPSCYELGANGDNLLTSSEVADNEVDNTVSQQCYDNTDD